MAYEKKISNSDLEDGVVIGEGGFGTVSKARMKQKGTSEFIDVALRGSHPLDLKLENHGR